MLCGRQSLRRYPGSVLPANEDSLRLLVVTAAHAGQMNARTTCGVWEPGDVLYEWS